MFNYALCFHCSEIAEYTYWTGPKKIHRRSGVQVEKSKPKAKIPPIGDNWFSSLVQQLETEIGELKNYRI